MSDKAAYVYIVFCADETLYTGWTTDITRRVAAHNEGRGAKYTRGRRPVKLVYQEWLATKRAARQREAEIKRLTRGQKMELIKIGPLQHSSFVEERLENTLNQAFAIKND